jgi:hypothetical protein
LVPREDPAILDPGSPETWEAVRLKAASCVDALRRRFDHPKNKKEIEMFYKSEWCLSVLVLAGVLALSAMPARAQDFPERVSPEPEVVPAAPVNYCHLKFPAIDEKTLGTERPMLQEPDPGNVIDFYGPCDHDPLGADEVQKQIQERSGETDSQFSD